MSSYLHIVKCTSLFVVGMIIVVMVLVGCSITKPNSEVQSDRSQFVCPLGEEQLTPERTSEAADRLLQEGNIEDISKILLKNDPSNQKMLAGLRAFIAAGGKFEMSNCSRRIIKQEDKLAIIRSACSEKIILDDTVIGEGRTGDDTTLVERNGCWYIVGAGEWPAKGWY
ncbi:MAG: hypothetical protein GXP38_15415 [Chloroflexi bacterium]|nr:hypothetical protein [Chloroflexota bacterium]